MATAASAAAAMVVPVARADAMLRFMTFPSSVVEIPGMTASLVCRLSGPVSRSRRRTTVRRDVGSGCQRDRHFGLVRHGVGQWGESVANAGRLRLVDEAEQHLLETRLHDTRHDVLPAIRLEHLGGDLLALRIGKRSAG